MKTQQINLSDQDAMEILHALEHDVLREMRDDSKTDYAQWRISILSELHHRIYLAFPELQKTMRKL